MISVCVVECKMHYVTLDFFLTGVTSLLYLNRWPGSSMWTVTPPLTTSFILAWISLLTLFYKKYKDIRIVNVTTK